MARATKKRCSHCRRRRIAKDISMEKSAKSGSGLSFKVDLSKRDEKLKDLFPQGPIEYSELVKKLWLFIQDNNLTRHHFPPKRRPKTV